jgi:transposase
MATTATTRGNQETACTPTLFLAFELGVHQWKLGFTTGAAQRPRERNVPARNIEAVREEISRAKQRFGFPTDARVVSCYEAGRDSFWLHRWLAHQGVDNCVVNSSSIEVNRRHVGRRRIASMCISGSRCSYATSRGNGRGGVSSRGPRVEEEDRHQLHRALTTTKRDRTRSINLSRGCSRRTAG